MLILTWMLMGYWYNLHSPKWEVREVATYRLSKYWPLTEWLPIDTLEVKCRLEERIRPAFWSQTLVYYQEIVEDTELSEGLPVHYYFRDTREDKVAQAVFTCLRLKKENQDLYNIDVARFRYRHLTSNNYQISRAYSMGMAKEIADKWKAEKGYLKLTRSVHKYYYTR